MIPHNPTGYSVNFGGYFKLAVSSDLEFKITTSRLQFGRTAASWEHLEYDLLDIELGWLF